MAKMEDYGISFINHGSWSDPEIRWRKSDYQTYLFNYWDVAECTEYEELCESEDDADLQELVAQLSELTPSSYERPRIDYEWVVDCGRYEYDDADYYKDYKLSPKKDVFLHNAGQALKQALSYLYDYRIGKAEIQIFRNVGGKMHLVALYDFQGSTLKDMLH